MPSRYFVNQLTDFAGQAAAATARLNNSRQKYKEKTLELAALCVQKFLPKQSNLDGGLYTGVAGLAYALWYAASKKTVFNDDERGQLLASAHKLIDFHLKYATTTRGEDAGFLLGTAGVCTVGSLVFNEQNDKSGSERCLQTFKKCAAASVESVNYLKHGSDELFVGRAGFLCGILNLRQKLHSSVFDDGLVSELIKTIIESGRQYAKGARSPCPLMYAYYDTEYLGAAHGLTGILQMALSFPTVNLSEDQVRDIKVSVDWLCSLQQQSGNFPCATDEMGGTGGRGTDELIHWCHGAPGTVLLLARAYLTWREERYLQAAIRCGEVVWEKGLLKKGPGICHGVAGNAYVFLLLYRLTEDERHLHRAMEFADFMSQAEFKNARTPDSPYSLFEGYAGTLCLYADLASGTEGKDGWEFPLMPVTI